jgi:hypothetical protein
MNKHFHSILTVILLFGGALRTNASPADFLDMDPGARPTGMGSAFTALADDGNAVLFNPAGLANMGLNKVEATGSYGFLSQDQFNNFLGISQQLPGNHYIGFDVLEYGVGNIAGTDQNGVPTSNLKDVELAFAGAFAHEFDYHFKAGISMSFLYQDLANVSARGFGGADLGILYVPSVMYDFSLGASIRHLGGFLTWDSGSTQTLSPDLRLGACLKLFDQFLTLAYDAERSFQNGAVFIHHAGGEVWIEKAVALRGGVDNGNPTMGASARYQNYGVDYSYEFELDGLGDSQRVSLDLFF